MPRISHGMVIALESIRRASSDPLTEHLGASTIASLAAPPAPAPPLTSFNYLFRKLQDDPVVNLLPQKDKTVADLIRLGVTMRDPGIDDPAKNLDSDIPSAYTYFGQFIAHDISLEAVTNDLNLKNPNLAPLDVVEIPQKIKNVRTATLDLDSIYAPAFYKGAYYPVPVSGDKMVIDRAVEGGIKHPAGTDIKDSDLPREKRNPQNPDFDRAAKIGDGRNDQNLIVSQLHLAFLRAHNAIVEQKGKSFNEAQQLLRQHYQYIVIKDFLERIAEPEIVRKILSGDLRIYEPVESEFFLPLEFTVAAYRFGHSMIRNSYNYNVNFEGEFKARLYQLFMARALGKYHHILESWIIQWDRFLEGGSNVARRIDTRLVEPLSAVPDAQGLPLKFDARLAVRDLLRGYILRMPTGQAVAQALNVQRLSEADLEAVAADVSVEQKEALHESGFSERTPLWFYILAEAAGNPSGRLGPVGSTLVAAVLIGLVRRSSDSILLEPNWRPTLGRTDGQFDLPELLNLAGVI